MTMIITLVIITVNTIMRNQVSIVINVIIISFQLSSSTEAAAAAKLSSQTNLHLHRNRHEQHQSHYSFIITITTVTTITFKKHWWLRANANINAGKRMQPINVKQNRLKPKSGSIKLNMHHTKISRSTLRKAASTQSQSQSQPSRTAEYDYNSWTICTTATRKEIWKQCKINIKSRSQIEKKETIATWNSWWPSRTATTPSPSPPSYTQQSHAWWAATCARSKE